MFLEVLAVLQAKVRHFFIKKFQCFNSGLNGYSSLYLTTTGQTTNETGQMFVGQQTGLVMMTRTAHALRFKTYSDEPLVTVPYSMQILGTGTRDVEILAPLKIKSASTVIDNGLTVGGTSTFNSDVSISATRNNNTSVETRITNLGSGYASSFLNPPGEEGQIWFGGGYGLNVRTNTESPITFQVVIQLQLV